MIESISQIEFQNLQCMSVAPSKREGEAAHDWREFPAGADMRVVVCIRRTIQHLSVDYNQTGHWKIQAKQLEGGPQNLRLG